MANQTKSMDIGGVVKTLRREHELTQQEFADKVGVARSYITQIELGNYSKIPWDLVRSICWNVIDNRKDRDKFISDINQEVKRFLYS